MEEVDKLILRAQKNEITEYYIYSKLANKIKEENNKKILKKIANDELKHYNIWKKYSKKEIKPNFFRVYWYIFLSSVLGLSFGLKLMEKREKLAKEVYKKIDGKFPLTSFIKDEHGHEKKLLNLIKEERVEYAGSIVLGLNDALVELTGALSGLTFALQNGKIIAITGFITGVAASMSMAASEYLSSREDDNKTPKKSAIYTGVAYIATVLLLILPYLLLDNIYLSLGIMLSIAILIIAGYTFYISTAKELKFGRRFLEMVVISITVAIISFLIGLIIRNVFMVEV
ncbi:MAG TPA: VIT1/CCC1 transporter family protein [Candidatus Nanoarchaeia archaeon]|nr:VIT1/CCC1 transporter family protein [Candidatus Nanoarchaeia archaeon]